MRKTKNQTSDDKDLIRQLAEADLYTFIKLVAPHEVWGSVHEELFSWWTREDAKDNQLVLLPRDHKKSKCIAYRCAWEIVRNSAITILYVSATALLAEKQLKSIKDILTSEIVSYYWPDLVNPQEGKRERWTVDEISVDHPIRKAEGVRDATVKAAGLTANVTGLHCQIAVLDDVVVPDNAYTTLGRDQVRSFYSQLSSIETTGAREWCVGTRYHPGDLYKDLTDMTEIYETEEGEEIEDQVYEVFQRVVETDGEFLWPKQRRADGKTFGFDARELARKKAKYLDTSQFYAQYYNNPNAVENQSIDRSRFQYYDKEKLNSVNGDWYIGDEPISVFAAMDFAYTIGTKSDFTVIAVIGVDEQNNYYILDIDRFKTNKISTMYERVEVCYRKWRFRRIRCEVVAAQGLIVQQFKDYMRTQRMMFSIDEYHPPRGMKKEERILAILEPRYQNGQIYHYKGGNCSILEEELIMTNSEHDDVKDAVASCVEICKAPVSQRRFGKKSSGNVIQFHGRFGGVAA
jgi:phage terminase large subunit-like protein